MNGFGMKEDFTHRLQFIRRVRIAENLLTVLDEVSLFHRENLAFRPPIHGKGDGVLRKALLDELKRKYSNCRHQDASFQEYGFGATMVTIK